MNTRNSKTKSSAQAPRSSSARANKPLVLEPRVLLDAAALSTANEVIDANQFVGVAPGAELESAQQQDLENALTETEAVAAQSNNDHRELVIIDSAVPDKQVLIDALNDNVQTLILDGETDAVTQITSALAGMEDLDAIHIVSHGSTGEVYLGNSVLTTESVAGEHRALVLAIGSSLGKDGDLLIYGCDVADGSAGAEFIDAVAKATEADVAASVDDTGSHVLGGDWSLEVSVGQLQSGIAFDAIMVGQWNNLLAPPVLDLDNNNNNSSGGTGYDTTYTEGNVGPSVVDSDSKLTDPDGDRFNRAEVTLVNAQVGDAFAWGFQSNGSVLSYDDTSIPGQIQLIVDYPAGSFPTGRPANSIRSNLRSINFFSQTDDPSTVDRIVQIRVRDVTGEWSNTAINTISVVSVNDAPFAHLDANGAPDFTTLTSTTPTVAQGIIGKPNGSGTFTLTQNSMTGYTSSQFSAAPEGIEIFFQTASANPDTFNFTFDITPDIGSDLEYVALSQRSVTTAGQNEDMEMTITWTGPALAEIYDPNNQITSHNNGDRITSGTVVQTRDNVGNTVATWEIRVPSVSVTVDALGAYASSGANSTANEWFAFDAVFANGGSVDFETTYTAQDPAIGVVDPGLRLFDPDSTDLSKVDLVLTNAQPNDVLSIGTLPPGITGTIDTTVPGQISIRLSGLATLADYETAMQAIMFSNNDNTAPIVTRLIEFTVTDELGADSPVAFSRIVFNIDPASDGIADPFDIDDDDDGIVDDNESIPGLDLLDVSAITTNTIPSITRGPATVNFGASTTSTGSGASVTGDANGILTFANDFNAISDTTTQTITLDRPANVEITSNPGPAGATFDPFDTIQIVSMNQVIVVDDPFNELFTEPGIYRDTVVLRPRYATYNQSWSAQVIDAPTLSLSYGTTTLAGAGTTSLEISLGVIEIDTDGDGVFDRLDIDSDDDGIPDNVEAQASAAYIAPSLVDSDKDGLDDAYDADLLDITSAASVGIVPVDSDGDLTFDFLDSNSDDDAQDDVDEAGHASTVLGADTDNDGLRDVFEGSNVNDGFDVNDEIVDAAGDFSTPDSDNDIPDNGAGAVPLVSDFDWRENSSPIVTDNTFTITEDGTATINVLIDDSDAEGDTLTVTEVDGQAITDGGPAVTVANGSVQLVGGNLVFTPIADYYGPVAFTYGVSDGNTTSTANVTGTVTPIADIVNDSFSTAEDTPVVIDPLANDTFENTGATVTAINGSAIAPGGSVATPNGTVAMDAAGVLTFTPATDFVGTDTFSYEVTSGGVTETAQIDVIVSPVNDAPVNTLGAPYTTPEETALTLTGLSIADVDAASGPMTVTLSVGNGVLNAANGTGVTVTGGGTTSITLSGTLADINAYLAGAGAPQYLPDVNYNGSDTLTMSTDDNGNTGGGNLNDTDSVPITVTPVNDAPVAVNDIENTDQDTVVSSDVTPGTPGQDSDVDGDTLSVVDINGAPASLGTPITLPSGALLTILADGSFDYDPNGAFDALGSSQSAQDTFTYTIDDGNGGQDTATVTLNITGLDDALTITDITDGPAAGTDAEVFEAGLPTGTSAGDGSANVSGTFTAMAGDGVQSLQIAGTAVTSLPTTITGTYGDLTITSWNPATGAAAYDYALTSAANHVSSIIDSFNVVLTDIDGQSTSAVLGVLINDDSPLAADDTDQTVNTAGNPSSTATGNVATGIDPGTDPNTVDGVADIIGVDTTATPVSGVVSGTGTPVAGNLGTPLAGTWGTLTLQPNGDYTYTPNFADPTIAALGPSVTLTDTFTYEVSDSDGSTSTALLEIDVVGTPAVIGLSDGSTSGTDGQVLESDLATGTNPAGTQDAITGSFSVITPEGLNNLAIGGTVITAADLANSGTTPVLVAMTYGTLEINGFNAVTGTTDYTYTLTTPADHSTGPINDSIAVIATDALGDAGGGVLAIEVVDDEPLATDDVGSATEDSGVAGTGTVDTNDVTGADQTSTPITGVETAGGTVGTLGSPLTGTYGDLTLNDNGTWSYLVDDANPTVDAMGAADSITDSFTYTRTDADGSTITAVLVITITGANDAPTAVDDTFTTAEDTLVNIPVLPNDTDPEGDTLTVASIDGQPAVVGTPITLASGLGTVTLLANGTIDFTPALNYNGLVSFDYTIDDGNGGTAQATVNGTITAVNDAPVAADDTFITDEDTAVIIDVVINDTDIDMDSLGVVSVDGQPITSGQTIVLTNGQGSVTLNADGTLSFTPVADFHGSAAFGYTVSDGNLTATANVAGTVTPVADIVDDTFTVVEDTPTILDLLLNDTFEDPAHSVIEIDGVPITAGGAAIPVANGSVLMTAAGDIEFTPNLDFNGTTSFTYTVATANNTETATANITVDAVNDPPVNTLPASFATNEDTAVALSGLSIADLDAAAAPMTITLSVASGTLAATAGTGVTVTGSGSASIVLTGSQADLNAYLASANAPMFTPAADFVGNVALTMVTDDGGATGSPGPLSDTDTSTIVVSPVNDAPINTLPPTYTVAEDSTLDLLGLAITDVDAATGVVTVTLSVDVGTLLAGSSATVTAAGAGTNTLTLTGTVADINAYLAGSAPQYQPPANVSGTANLQMVTDDAGNTGAGGPLTDTDASVITITDVNDDPVNTFPASYTTPEDTGIALTGLAIADIDANGGVMTVTLSVTNGTLTAAAAPGVSVSGSGTTALTLSGTIADINALLAGAGAPLYDPDLNFNGTDPLTFSTSDNGNTGPPGPITTVDTTPIIVTAVNDLPIAVNDSYATDQDTLIPGDTTPGTAGQDSDVDLDVLSIVAINGAPVTLGSPTTLPSGALLTINADGSFIYDPNNAYDSLGSTQSAQDSFDYTIDDANGGQDTATVTIDIDGLDDALVLSDLSDGPIAGTDGEVFEAGLPAGTLAGNGTDVYTGSFTALAADGVTTFTLGGSAVTAGLVVPGAYGDLTIVAFNATTGLVDYTYTLNTNVAHTAVITDSFALVLTDNDSQTVTDTLAILINDDAPTATNDTGTATEDSGVAGTGTVDPNDLTGADATATPISAVQTAGGIVGTIGSPLVGTYGSLTLLANGNWSYVVDDANATVDAMGATDTLTDSFTYTRTDSDGSSVTATLIITIAGANDNPVAVNDTFSTNEDTLVNIPVLSNDSDVEGDTLTVATIDGQPAVVGTPITLASGVGTVTLLANGTIDFTPALNYNGPVSFDYTIDDGAGGTATATVTGTVVAVNDAPIANPDTLITDEDTAVTIDPVANDTDVDPDTLSIVSVDGQNIIVGQTITLTNGQGSVTLNPTGTITFTPAPDFHGPINFGYTVSDGALTDTSTVTGTVNPIVDIANDTYTVSEDSTTTLALLSNDSFEDVAHVVSQIDGNPITAGGPAVAVTNGSVVMTAAGDIEFTPSLNYNGPVSFTYTVATANNTETATVNITVDAVNDPPVHAVPGLQTTNEDVPIVFNAANTNLITVTDLDAAPGPVQTTLTVPVTDGTLSAVAAGSATITGVGTNNVVVTGLPADVTATLDGLTFSPTSNFFGSSNLHVHTDDLGNTGAPGPLVADSDIPINILTVAANLEWSITGVASEVEGTPAAYVVSLTGTPDTGETATVRFTLTDITASAADHATIDAAISAAITARPEFSWDPATRELTVTGTGSAIADLAVNLALPDNAIVQDGRDYRIALDLPSSSTGEIVGVGTAGAVVTTILDNDYLEWSLTGDPTVNEGAGANYTLSLTGNMVGATEAVLEAGGGNVASIWFGRTDVETNSADYSSFDAAMTAATAGRPELWWDTSSQVLSFAGNGAAMTDLTFVLPTIDDVLIEALQNYDVTLINPSSASGADVRIDATLDTVRTGIIDNDDATDDSATTPEDTPVVIDVLANDAFEDPSNSVITVDGQAVTPGATPVTVANGTVHVNAAGQLVFTPNANYFGVTTFTYEAQDSIGNIRDALVTVTVVEVNDPPVAVDDNFVTNEDTPITINPLGNDSDIDSDPLTITEIDGQPVVVGQPITLADGTGFVVVNANGTVSYTPNPNYFGPVTFTVLIDDGRGGTDMSTVTGIVTSVNDVPVAVDDYINVITSITPPIDLLVNDSDIDNDPLTVSHIDGQPATVGVPITLSGGLGTATLLPGGQLLYDPAPGAPLNFSFPYTITDGTASATANVHVAIAQQNSLFEQQAGLGLPSILDDDVTGLHMGSPFRPYGPNHPDTLEPVTGIIDKTVNEFKSLNSNPILPAQGAVLAAANGANPLGTIVGDYRGARPVTDTVERLNTASTINDHLELRQLPFEDSDVRQLTIDSNALISGETDHGIRLQAMTNGARVWLQAIDLKDGSGPGSLVGIHASLANGRELPPWLNVVDGRLVLISRPAGEDPITVRIVLLTQDRTAHERILVIDFTQEELKFIERPARTQSSGFSAQLGATETTVAQSLSTDELAQALNNQPSDRT